MVWTNYLIGILLLLLILTIFLFLRKLEDNKNEHHDLATNSINNVESLEEQPLIENQKNQKIQKNQTPFEPQFQDQTPPENQKILENQKNPKKQTPPEIQAPIEIPEIQAPIEIPEIQAPIEIPEIQAPIEIREIRQRRRIQDSVIEITDEPTVNRNHRKEYYAGLEKHEDAPQNAHDKQVNIYLRKKYKRLIELLSAEKLPDMPELDVEELEQLRIEQTFMEIRGKAEEYINSKDYLQESAKRIEIKKVNMALDQILKAYTITSISEDLKPVKETVVLTNVWRRIHQPANVKNYLELEVAVIDALLDSVERKSPFVNALGDLFMLMAQPQQLQMQTEFSRNYSTVCINGRVSRILTALTLLDADEQLAAPVMDMSELKNEAYMKSSRIVDELFETKSKEFREFYNKNSDDLTTEQEWQIQEFEKDAKEKIKTELTKDYKHLVSQSELTEIIKNAQAGVNSDI